MVVMNPLAPNSLFHLDLERAKIVEEWKVHDDITVNHVAPNSKFSQTTHEQTLIGASHNALFRIDPRVSGNKLVNSQYKQYASKNKFSGVTTTASGKLAVASEKGDIRLYDTVGKIAKTALMPLGDPIIGIDVSADGRWIVATTKTYLLLVDVLIGQGRYAGSLGFDRSFPADAKPMPKRLQLRPEHVAYMNHNVSFTPARFVFLKLVTNMNYVDIYYPGSTSVRGRRRTRL
jgi:VID27 C-terminal WD40-like domain